MRVFLGCPIPPDVASEMAAWAARSFDPRVVRFVPSENLHVTLAFYGEVPVDQLEVMISRVREVPWRAVEGTTGRVLKLGRNAVSLEVDGLLSDPWSAELIELWKMQPYREKRRDPRPHVTVARLRPNVECPILPPSPGFTFSLDRLVLFQSVLSSEGSTYTRLAEARR